MKTKACAACGQASTVAYRVQAPTRAPWIFFCPQCLPKQQAKAGYRYGGTWKGERH